jgi:hypothetical protein
MKNLLNHIDGGKSLNALFSHDGCCESNRIIARNFGRKMKTSRDKNYSNSSGRKYKNEM